MARYALAVGIAVLSLGALDACGGTSTSVTITASSGFQLGSSSSSDTTTTTSSSSAATSRSSTSAARSTLSIGGLSRSETGQSGGTASSSGVVVTIPPAWFDHSTDSTELSALPSGIWSQVYVLVDQPPPGQFEANVNDVRAQFAVGKSSRSPVADENLAALVQATKGATNIQTPTTISVGGEQCQTTRYDLDISGTPGRVLETACNHLGDTYDILFVSSAAAFDQQVGGAQQMLQSLRWVG